MKLVLTKWPDVRESCYSQPRHKYVKEPLVRGQPRGLAKEDSYASPGCSAISSRGAGCNSFNTGRLLRPVPAAKFPGLAGCVGTDGPRVQDLRAELQPVR